MSGHWAPDGHGLPSEALELNARYRQPVHLRLTNADTRAARGACDHSLGQLWTGVPAQVTCRACLEVVHA